MIDHLALHLAVRAHARTVAVCTTGGAFARASSATYHDANGIVQTAAVDVYRSAHYVNGVLTPLYEAAGANLVPYSEQLDQWTDINADVSANATTAPDGTMTADRVTVSGGFVSARRMRATVFTGTGTKSVSAYLKEYSTNRPTGIAILEGGATVVRRVRVTWTAGVPALSSVTGTGTLGTSEELANGWWRVSFTATGFVPSGDDWVTLYPWDTCDGTDDDSGVYAWGIQAEDGASASSYIPTTAAAATRAADTGSASLLAATTTGYTRAAGSFLTDGFAVGMEVTPTGFTQTAVGTITEVSALAMTINGGRTAQSSGSGRTLAVGFPSRVHYENRRLVPDAGHPYVAEEYLPGGGPSKETVGAFGELEVRPTYVLRLHAPPDSGISALRQYTDALTTHFAPGTPIAVGTDTARVRTDVGPFASPIQQTEDGWAVTVLSIPLRLRTANSR